MNSVKNRLEIPGISNDGIRIFTNKSLGRFLSIFKAAVKNDEGDYISLYSLRRFIKQHSNDLEDSPKPPGIFSSAQQVRNCLQGLHAKKNKIVELNFEPCKLPSGKFLKSLEENPKLPDLVGMKDRSGVTVIETDKMYAAAFACCFHTGESVDEITARIQKACVENDASRQGLFSQDIKKEFPVTKARFYNNLVNLLNSLPGEQDAKIIKIYWDDNLARNLMPILLKEENVDPRTFAFAMVSGEGQGINAPFQIQDMDFSRQLCFIGVNREQVMTQLRAEVDQLSHQVLGEGIADWIHRQLKAENEMVRNAEEYTLYNQIRNRLIDLSKKESHNLSAMNELEKEQFLTRKLLQEVAST